MTHPINVFIKTIDDTTPSWPEIAGKCEEGTITSFSILENGTDNGNASVAFKIELNNDKFIIAQLTQGQFEMLAATLSGAIKRFSNLKKQRQTNGN